MGDDVRLLPDMLAPSTDMLPLEADDFGRRFFFRLPLLLGRRVVAEGGLVPSFQPVMFPIGASSSSPSINKLGF